MTLCLLSLATNLLERRRPSPRPESQSCAWQTLDAISCIRTDWIWDGERLSAETFNVLTLELDKDPKIRRRQLGSWATKADPGSPMIMATVGGHFFVPVLRRMYLAADLTCPAVLGFADTSALFRFEPTTRTHLDLARFLACEAGAELCGFMEDCGIETALARACTDTTIDGALLRSTAAFHMVLRVLGWAGRLDRAERRCAEARLLGLLPAGSRAASVSACLASETGAANFVPENARRFE